MASEPLRYATISELGTALRRRETSAVELAQAALELLEAEGSPLNAVARLTPQVAQAQAEQADRELAEGRDRGPLHGLPYGAKDLLDTAGIGTEYGSPTHRGRVPSTDAATVIRLRQAGAVLVAKLSMIPLAGGGGYGGPGASLGGPVRTPWNTAHWAGGSSSGSGAAVGAGLLPFSIGSETWGSIVCPAAFCGISGLRPTYGRVPSQGAMALSWTMDKVGPLARSAADCATVLRALDPTWTPLQSRSTGTRPLAGLRGGVIPRDYAHADPQTEGLFRAAVAVLADLGLTIEDAQLPAYPYESVASTVVRAEGSAAFEDLIRGPELDTLPDEGQRRGLRAGLALTAVEYLKAMRVRAALQADAAALFGQFDVLLSPTYLRVAPPADVPFDDQFDGGDPLGALGNLCGLPAISVPMGYGPHGLPLGLCITGDVHAEGAALAVAQAYQQASDWHSARPPSGQENRGHGD